MFRLWHTVDTNNDYYFKLCEETTSIPQGTSMVWVLPFISPFIYSHKNIKQQNNSVLLGPKFAKKIFSLIFTAVG